ncbi:hypothetical protein [Prochlorococcus marinus]|uniref:hypothetical protein n=1 Tax=Prochlorococcus marinus TaxID=1219 RepID=UPI00130E7772|nr:hypothetical protein [Prochlorococcus marinus]
MVVTTIIFHSVGVEIIQESKALHRLCGQRGAYDSKRANKCPLIFFFDLLYRSKAWKGREGCCSTVTCDSCQRIIFQL